MKTEIDLKVWEKKYPIAYYDVDFKQVLKPSALLNYLQDMATVNAEMLGFGYSFTHPKNYGWFLVKYHMEFDDYPQELNEILIKTEPRGYNKILANRDFEVWETNGGKRLGKVSSCWMLIDLNTKRPLSPSKIFDFMPSCKKRESDMEYEKIPQIENIDFEKIFEIRYDDIDVNQHVNNANYVVWAFEVLPFEFKTLRKLKKLDISYKKEIKYGHNVISQTQINEDTTLHIVKNASTQEELCTIKAVWS